jgi:pyruvate/2-oxoglutarate dehydrogenase complex dihydrolipoamide acyltransferase (E2) component
MNAAIPQPAPEELPECHANGSQPQGYDREDPVCWNCRDKFTCLPNALDKSLVVGSLQDDSEIHAVLSEDMSFRSAIERMKTRLRVTQAGGEIPPGLDVRVPVVETGVRPVAVPPEPEPEPEPAPEPEPPAPEPEPAPEPAAVAPTPVAPPAKRKRAKRPSRALVNAEGLPTLKSGKPLPPVRQLNKKQMKAALARIKVAQPFPLELGMQLVRRTKDGDTIIVRLMPTGFELDGVIYSSLSTAIMYRLRKVTSGNAYFDLTTHQCTEIWSEDGDVLAGYIG